MNNRNLWLLLGMLVGVTILCYSLSRTAAPVTETIDTSFVEVPDVPVHPSTAIEESASGVTCYTTPLQFVIERSSSTGGDDVIIKNKTTVDQKFPCEYSFAAGDRELKSTGPTYVLSVVPGYIFFDTGTAPPPRGLSVYDMKLRKVVYGDMYSGPTTSSDSAFSYWQPQKTPATAENCPQLQEYTKNGLGAGVETEVVLELATLEIVPTGQTRCSARQ